MQTIASLAGRLDMTQEEAVEKLKYMLFDVDGVDTPISDEEYDLLIDLDDDPSIADKIRNAKLKEQERAKKAAEKAAATKRAKAKAAAKAAEKAAEAEHAATADATAHPFAEILGPEAVPGEILPVIETH